MRGDEDVLAHFERARASQVLVAEPAWAEIEYGIARLQPSRRRERLSNRLELLRKNIQTTPWTADVSACFGIIKAVLEKRGARLEDFDLAIAAHALAIDATLVTGNQRHLGRVDDLKLTEW